MYCAGTSFFSFTDENGNYLIKDIPYGQYDLRVQKDGFIPAKISLVNLFKSNNLSSADIMINPVILTPINPKNDSSKVQYTSISGKAILTGGLSHGGILVSVDGTNYKTITDQKGLYSFPTIPTGKYRFIFSKENYKQKEVNVNAFSKEKIALNTIELQSTKAVDENVIISGIVEMYNEKGERADDYDLVLITIEGTNNLATPDQEGNFMFQNLPKGIYVLSAKAPGYKLKERINVELINTKTAAVVIALNQDVNKMKDVGYLSGNIKLKGIDDVGGDSSGILVGLAGADAMAFTDNAGNFYIRDVAIGEYKFIAQAEGFFPYSMDNVKILKDQITNIAGIELEVEVFPPTVIFTSPTDNEKNVMIKEALPIYVRFSKKMDPSTVKSAFSISPQVDYEIYMGKENSNSDFDLLLVNLLGNTTNAPVKYDSSYTITIANSATDYDGLSLQEPYTFSFTTGKASVVSTFPQDGAESVNIRVNNPIKIYFNAKIDHSSLNENNISISPTPLSNLQVQGIDDQDEVGWTQSHIIVNLKEDTQYTITVGVNVKTLSGSKLQNTPYKFSFKTAKSIELK